MLTGTWPNPGIVPWRTTIPRSSPKLIPEKLRILVIFSQIYDQLRRQASVKEVNNVQFSPRGDLDSILKVPWFIKGSLGCDTGEEDHLKRHAPITAPASTVFSFFLALSGCVLLVPFGDAGIRTITPNKLYSADATIDCKHVCKRVARWRFTEVRDWNSCTDIQVVQSLISTHFLGFCIHQSNVLLTNRPSLSGKWKWPYVR